MTAPRPVHEHEFEPQFGLPERLPDSERLLWQGSPSWRALAIVARTYALANAGRHEAEGFDLCDLTHCQVLRASTPASRAAAQRTSGEVLLDGERLAEVFYTASCGGHTEKPSNVWPAHSRATQVMAVAAALIAGTSSTP